MPLQIEARNEHLERHLGIHVREFRIEIKPQRALQEDDNALLKSMTPVFDSLYAGYAKAGPK